MRKTGLDSRLRRMRAINRFRQCSVCSAVWPNRDSFLSDPAIHILGYQVNFQELTEGLFLLNHSCGTTLAIKAGDFQDLYKGPIHQERLTGSEECPRYCLRKEELRPCPTKCECAYVREIVQIVKNWPKMRGRA